MKIIEKLSLEIPGTNTHFFNLTEFNDENSKNALFFGYTFIENGIDSNLLKQHDNNIYLNVTMPTEFCSIQSTDSDDIFDEVWGICPYTNKWLNEIKNTDKYKTIFYPFNKKDIPTNTDKIYDVIYHGGIHGSKYVKMLELINRFNYRYITQTHGINSLTQNMLKFATNTNLTNSEKIDLISKTKISICFNSFEVRSIQDLNNVKSRKEWYKNEAFKHVDDLSLIPQFKSRCNEAAFSKTLNLIQRDPWNIIERYYSTDEFVYFDSVDDLPNIIQNILDNWGDYVPMIERAYQKSLNYTTENLYKLIKNNDNIYDL
jgi:hypothetical protein